MTYELLCHLTNQVIRKCRDEGAGALPPHEKVRVLEVELSKLNRWHAMRERQQADVEAARITFPTQADASAQGRRLVTEICACRDKSAHLQALIKQYGGRIGAPHPAEPREQEMRF